MAGMHEWALAEAVLESVRENTRDQRGRVVRVLVRFGELQQIDREIFEHGLRELCADYPFPADVFEVETESAELRCGACGHRWRPMDGLDEEQAEAIHFLPEASHAHLRCPQCGSADFAIEAGRGVSIASIEVEE